MFPSHPFHPLLRNELEIPVPLINILLVPIVIAACDWTLFTPYREGLFSFAVDEAVGK